MGPDEAKALAKEFVERYGDTAMAAALSPYCSTSSDLPALRHHRTLNRARSSLDSRQMRIRRWR